MNLLVKRILTGTTLAGAAVTVACGDDATSPLAGRGQTMSLSFSGVRPPGVSGVQSVQAPQADSLVLVVGSDRLVISSAEVVLREIELKRVTVTDCDSVVNEDACEEFTIGPSLVSLPLAAGASTALSVAVDSGTYSEVEFEIHKPGSDALDAAFVAANPDFADISIRVRGTYNGTAFTFTSRLNEEQEFAFSPPLVVDASGTSTNLTIRLDVSTWFRTGQTTGNLIDPATANAGGANENVVRDNIKASIKAFEDQDKDGDERDG